MTQYKNPWKTLESRIVYENPWLRLREDQVIRPDGQPGVYSVVEIRPSVGIVVLDVKRRVALVGQWRYAHNKFSWEIPTGGSSSGEESILKSAQRELAEETGIRANDWQTLGSIDNSNGATTDVAHLYLARDLTLGVCNQEGTEELIMNWIPLEKAVSMVMDGDITESCSVAAILKVERLLSE
jgi:8-oxo-dGTP pyrophosphatase MutT (NUDIX family)